VCLLGDWSTADYRSAVLLYSALLGDSIPGKLEDQLAHCFHNPAWIGLEQPSMYGMLQAGHQHG